MKWSKRTLSAHSSAGALAASCGVALIESTSSSATAATKQATCGVAVVQVLGSDLQRDPLIDMLAILQSKTLTVTATAIGADSTMFAPQRETGPITADGTVFALADWAGVYSRQVLTPAAVQASARERCRQPVLPVAM